MYFTENRYDRSIEWMMKGVPNFYPRGSGIVVTGKFEYTAEMCDCRLCEHYGGKLRGCKVPRCVCLEERIAVGVASLKEVMKETMSEIKHSGFNRRLRKYIKESEVKELAKYSDEDSVNAQSKVNEIVRLTDILENQPLQFNNELIRQMLQCVVVESKDRIKVIFNDGTEIEQPIL